MIKLREQSLTMTLDGKKEVQSCPNDKRNELCVSMAIKMKDDNFFTTNFGIGIFTFNQIIENNHNKSRNLCVDSLFSMFKYEYEKKNENLKIQDGGR